MKTKQQFDVREMLKKDSTRTRFPGQYWNTKCLGIASNMSKNNDAFSIGL